MTIWVGIRIVQIEVIAEAVAPMIIPIRAGALGGPVALFDRIDAANAIVPSVD